jgi:LysM repeat protein
MRDLMRRAMRGIGIVTLLLIVSACSAPNSGTNPDATTTPLNPGMFPPEGTPQGPGQHTPVITPIADAAETLAPGPNPNNVNVNATAVPPVVNIAPTTVAVNMDGSANTGEVFAPTVTPQSLPALGGNANVDPNAGANTTTDTTTNDAAANVNANCAPPAGWVTYTVQTGDSLGVLAENAGLSLGSLATANCLTDADAILAGQVLYIPGAGGNAVASVPTVAVAANNTVNNNTTTDMTNANANNAVAAAPAVGANVPVATGNLIGVVVSDPAIVSPGGEFQLTSGTTVTLRALGVGNTATQFTFYLMPVDAAPGTQGTVLGTDTNIADGITILWTIPTPNLRASIWAVANTGATTQPVVIVTK